MSKGRPKLSLGDRVFLSTDPGTPTVANILAMQPMSMTELGRVVFLVTVIEEVTGTVRQLDDMYVHHYHGPPSPTGSHALLKELLSTPLTPNPMEEVKAPAKDQGLAHGLHLLHDGVKVAVQESRRAGLWDRPSTYPTIKRPCTSSPSLLGKVSFGSFISSFNQFSL